MNPTNALLIIDPQNDFCNPAGALYVPGAEEDIWRLTRFLRNDCARRVVNKVYVSLDTHVVQQIFHPVWWRSSQGEHPEPFTVISHRDVVEGRWVPADPDRFNQSLSYVEALETGGKHQLVIWPEHCLAYTHGWQIAKELAMALHDHAQGSAGFATMIHKGENPITEFYSVVEPEVVHDPREVNTVLLETLSRYDTVFVAGQARSHCVLSTLESFAKKPALLAKTVLLSDCTSDVQHPEIDFTTLTDAAIERLCESGLRVEPIACLR